MGISSFKVKKREEKVWLQVPGDGVKVEANKKEENELSSFNPMKEFSCHKEAFQHPSGISNYASACKC